MSNDKLEAPALAPAQRPPIPKPQFTRDGLDWVLPTLNNAVKALGRPDLCGMRIRSDGQKYFLVAEPGTDNWRQMTDVDLLRLRLALERMKFKNVSKRLVLDGANFVGTQNANDLPELW